MSNTVQLSTSNQEAGPKRTDTLWDTDNEDDEEETHFVELMYSQDDVEEAKAWGKKLGVLYNSITRGQHNYIGRLGEILVCRYINGKIMDDYNYDILTPSGEKLEVKSKRIKAVTAPLPTYENAVCAKNYKQKCDYYVFVRISTETNKAWICGKKSPSAFKEAATFKQRGDSDGKFTYKADCYVLYMTQLEAL